VPLLREGGVRAARLQQQQAAGRQLAAGRRAQRQPNLGAVRAGFRRRGQQVQRRRLQRLHAPHGEAPPRRAPPREEQQRAPEVPPRRLRRARVAPGERVR
jgi:hypothetical protein